MEHSFCIGELVWGKLSGYPFWPGKILSHLEINEKDAEPDKRWVQWFGDNKYSLVNTCNLKEFKIFKEYFSEGHYKRLKLYKTSVHQALLLAAGRAGYTAMARHAHLGPLMPKYEALICWANENFPPYGPDSLKPNLDEATPIDSEGNHEIYTKKLKTMKDVRVLRVNEVKAGKIQLKDFCLVCGDESVVTDHPLFEGGLCEDCKVEFLQTAFLYDEDGNRSFCSICSEGKKVLVCDQPSCSNIMCTCCLDVLVGPGTSQQELQLSEWMCYMCRSKRVHGLLRRRPDWRQKLHQICRDDVDSRKFPNSFVYAVIPPRKRKPIRVLSLFDGISSVRVILEKLGIKVGCYYASESKPEAIIVSNVQQYGSIIRVPEVKNITSENLVQWGPIDLLIGGCHVSDILPSKKKNKELPYSSSVCNVYEFYRILNLLITIKDPDRPFFWLFEGEADMDVKDEFIISKFLKDEAVIVDGRFVSAINRRRNFWGNLPGMNRLGLRKKMHSQQTVQDCLETDMNRQAQITHLDTIRPKPRVKSHKVTDLPVKVEDDEYDALWTIEIERLFGFPEHYTDVHMRKGNVKLKLLCESWSLPLVKCLLTPLKEYYECDELDTTATDQEK